MTLKDKLIQIANEKLSIYEVISLMEAALKPVCSTDIGEITLRCNASEYSVLQKLLGRGMVEHVAVKNSDSRKQFYSATKKGEDVLRKILTMSQ